MKALDIINSLNRVLKEQNKEGFFITKLNIEKSNISKLYKTYTLEVWYYNITQKQLVITIQKSARVPEYMDEVVLRDLNMELCYTLFRDYDKIMSYA